MKRYSILQDKKECIVCGQRYDLHMHEVFFGKNRQKSIKDGCCAYLCSRHHNMSNSGVHYNIKLDIELKQKMQQKWMDHYKKNTDDFIKEYEKNYL